MQQLAMFIAGNGISFSIMQLIKFNLFCELPQCWIFMARKFLPILMIVISNR